MNPRTLRFSSWESEKAFMAGNRSTLTLAMIVGSGIILFWMLANLSLWFIGGTLDSAGEAFIVSPDTEAAAQIRVIAHILVAVDTFVVVAVGFLARWTPRLGERFLEIITVMGTVVLQLVHPMTHAWYASKRVGIDDPKPYLVDEGDWRDHSYLFFQLVILYGIHVAAPIRWVIIWPSELAAPLMYMFCAFYLGSPTKFAWCFMFLSILVGVSLNAGFGKRTLEYFMRKAFSSVTFEKMRRFQAEFQLNNVGSEHQAHVSVAKTPDVKSVVSSHAAGGVLASDTGTDQLFACPATGADIGSQLDAIIELGPAMSIGSSIPSISTSRAKTPFSVLAASGLPSSPVTTARRFA